LNMTKERHSCDLEELYLLHTDMHTSDRNFLKLTAQKYVFDVIKIRIRCFTNRKVISSEM